MTTADELRAMLDKAKRYTVSAESLRTQGDLDSAMSRIYYAMFYCAEALLLAKGYTYSSHKAVIAAFGQHFVKTGQLPQNTHQWLREAFEKRQISDYDFVTSLTEPDAIDLAEKARQFISITEDYLERSGYLK